MEGKRVWFPAWLMRKCLLLGPYNRSFYERGTHVRPCRLMEARGLDSMVAKLACIASTSRDKHHKLWTAEGCGLQHGSVGLGALRLQGYELRKVDAFTSAPDGARSAQIPTGSAPTVGGLWASRSCHAGIRSGRIIARVGWSLEEYVVFGVTRLWVGDTSTSFCLVVQPTNLESIKAF